MYYKFEFKVLRNEYQGSLFTYIFAMITKRYFLALVLITVIYTGNIFPQEEEIINYFQLEPLDDSLFIQIQQQFFIDPPDPKAEIIADLRDAANQTITIKGVIYPFLSLTTDLRAKIQVYPFKLNLEETVNYGSVFTRVISRLRLNKVIAPPTLYQISSTLSYVNPFLQLFGAERFGVPLKKDVGFSFGLGTPYSGVFETNFVEGNFHILGFSAGIFGSFEEITIEKSNSNYNNLYASYGIQMSYVIPFGNFFQMGYISSSKKVSEARLKTYTNMNDPEYHIKIIEGEYFNWEFRYPIRILGATRSKFYVANFLKEVHIGFTGRELSVAGSTFDLRIDAMAKSDNREPQLVMDVLVQKIFDSWAFSSFGLGPSIILTEAPDKRFGISSIFLNFRLKIGTSL